MAGSGLGPAQDLELLGRSAAEVVFVDDFPENLEPACELGIAALLFEDPRQVRRVLVAAGVRIKPTEAAR